MFGRQQAWQGTHLQGYARAAGWWLMVGAALAVAVPSLRTGGGSVGWLPLWILVGAPILVLIQVDVLAGFEHARRWRRRLLAMRRSTRVQARRRTPVRIDARAA